MSKCGRVKAGHFCHSWLMDFNIFSYKFWVWSSILEDFLFSFAFIYCVKKNSILFGEVLLLKSCCIVNSCTKTWTGRSAELCFGWSNIYILWCLFWLSSPWFSTICFLHPSLQTQLYFRNPLHSLVVPFSHKYCNLERKVGVFNLALLRFVSHGSCGTLEHPFLEFL